MASAVVASLEPPGSPALLEIRVNLVKMEHLVFLRLLS
jgi:hypothetical protein